MSLSLFSVCVRFSLKHCDKPERFEPPELFYRETPAFEFYGESRVISLILSLIVCFIWSFVKS